MPEMTQVREHHGNVMFITGIDHFLITLRSTRLDDRGHTALGRSVNAVPEGKEGI